MARRGARPVQVTTAQAATGANLLGGPLRLFGWSFTAGTAAQDLTNRGTQNAPAAGTTIASLALPNGQYQVEWTVELSGTPGVADVDNVSLSIGATQVATSSNLGVGGEYPQEMVTVAVAGGPLTLTAKAIGNATVGSVYVVTLIVLPVTSNAATILDGSGLPVGFISVEQGDTETQQLGEGVTIESGVSVLATEGAVSGVLYINTELDIADPLHAHKA